MRDTGKAAGAGDRSGHSIYFLSIPHAGESAAKSRVFILCQLGAVRSALVQALLSPACQIAGMVLEVGVKY